MGRNDIENSTSSVDRRKGNCCIAYTISPVKESCLQSSDVHSKICGNFLPRYVLFASG